MKARLRVIKWKTVLTYRSLGAYSHPCDIATGQTRTIVSTRGDGREFAYYSVISPDAKQVAYSFWDGELYDLRIVGIEGGTSRTLFRKAEVRDLIPMAWSPDAGNILAFIQWKDLTSQIAFISAATGEALKP